MRKIVVDGIEYKYTIGKHYTKIYDIGVYANGIYIGRFVDGDHKTMVTPADVASAIKRFFNENK